ncbi:MAG: tetratricopeptide repeat protein [Nitrospinota bacterium]|nr:MAG: tetratricopeptide repeat protein [Nitrospinota bacterium]
MCRLAKVFLLWSIVLFTSCAGMGVRPTAQSAFDQGLALFNRGEYEAALPHFAKATEIDPDFAQAYLYLGRTYLNLHRWREAIPPLRTAYRLSPESMRKEVVNILIDALLGGALFEIERGNLSSSISYFKEVIELGPSSTQVDRVVQGLLTLGGALLTQGQVSQAIEVYQDAVNLAPDTPAPYLGLARALFKQGDLFQALQVVRNAMQLDPTSRELRSFWQELQRQ